MADTKISALAAASALAGTEVVPVVQSGTTKKATVQAIADMAAGGVTLEQVQDNLGTTFMVAGTLISLTYDDTANTLTVAVTSLTETVQDIIGALASGGSALTMTYNDGADTWVLDVNVDGSTIEVSADALRIKDAGVTYAKIQNVSATDKILGRVSSGAGVIEEITFTDQVQQLADDTSFDVMLGTLGASPRSTQYYDLAAGSSQNLSRAVGNGNLTALTSAVLYVVLMPVYPGQVVANVQFFSGSTAASGATHCWGGIWAFSGLAKLRVSADDTSATPWSINTEKVFALTTSYTVPDGVYKLYAGVVVVGTVPTLRGVSGVAQMNGLAPIMAGTGSGATLTDPASAPDPISSITGAASVPWCRLT